ncbi:hypothetical protein ACSQ67_006670 [Phaseolus vulgaris]
MSKLIFHRQMLEYPCLMQDPLLAKARGHANGVVCWSYDISPKCHSSNSMIELSWSYDISMETPLVEPNDRAKLVVRPF